MIFPKCDRCKKELEDSGWRHFVSFLEATPSKNSE